jgi:uncharacterized membrane protein HdeD (DUF308 family)
MVADCDGIASIVLALALFANPAAGALAMVWLIGVYALITGVILIALAFRLPAVPQRLEQLTQH